MNAEKKTAVITGVAGGIGLASAQLFIESGWQVIGIDRRFPCELPGGFSYVECDMSDPEAAAETFKKIADTADKVDVLVNNAAIQICKPLGATEVHEWDAVMAANLRSIYLSVRHLLPLLRTPGGAIVNVSSVHALATSGNISAYAASKGGVLSLTRALAVELATSGIRVNAVLPGAVDTDMLRAGLSRGHLLGDVDEKLRSLSHRTPLGRIGRPREIAHSILFLAANEYSSFITGQSLVVDGGALARLSTE